jgi:acyl-CoA thioesterase-1
MRSRVVAGVALAVWAGVSVSGACAQVVALGASNTRGFGVGAAAAYPAQLQALLSARGIKTDVANAGIDGDTTAWMLERLDSAVPKGTKVVIVQYGGNDARQRVPPQETQANIGKIEGKLRARGIKIVDAMPSTHAALRAGLKRDSIHLSAEGHKQVAQSVLSSVAAALR